MHVLFRDGYANRPDLEKYTDCPRELEAHLETRTPEWASAITGLGVAEIETFAKMVWHHAEQNGTSKKKKKNEKQKKKTKTKKKKKKYNELLEFCNPVKRPRVS